MAGIWKQQVEHEAIGFETSAPILSAHNAVNMLKQQHFYLSEQATSSSAYLILTEICQNSSNSNLLSLLTALPVTGKRAQPTQL